MNEEQASQIAESLSKGLENPHQFQLVQDCIENYYHLTYEHVVNVCSGEHFQVAWGFWDYMAPMAGLAVIVLAVVVVAKIILD